MTSDLVRIIRQLEMYRGLVQVSGLINSITESQKLFAEILTVAKSVTRSEAATLFLSDQKGDLLLEASNGGPPLPSKKIVVPRGKGISGWVVENRQALLVKDAYADARFFREADMKTGFQTRSILCVPLLQDGMDIGAIQVLNPMDRDAYDEDDLEPMVAYGNIVATAIENLRNMDRVREQQRLAHEVSAARDIQESLLPNKLPATDKFMCAAQYRPARNVGGDFYDVVETNEDEAYFVIGDVSGKGMPAALLMAQALSTVRSAIRPGDCPSEVLARWNASLNDRVMRGVFITAIVGRVIPSERRFEIACAGHCHPYIVGMGLPETVRLPAVPPIGVVKTFRPRTTTITMAPGQWMVLYTDGLPESLDANRVPLGACGVETLLVGPFATPTEITEVLKRGERNHRGDAEPHDDLTLLVMGCP